MILGAGFMDISEILKDFTQEDIFAAGKILEKIQQSFPVLHKNQGNLIDLDNLVSTLAEFHHKREQEKARQN